SAPAVAAALHAAVLAGAAAPDPAAALVGTLAGTAGLLLVAASAPATGRPRPATPAGHDHTPRSQP
ncbi:hypothetical protein ACWGB8_22275, partial [Kitasatospora sp. NPDC054939]